MIVISAKTRGKNRFDAILEAKRYDAENKQRLLQAQVEAANIEDMQERFGIYDSDESVGGMYARKKKPTKSKSKRKKKSKGCGCK